MRCRVCGELKTKKFLDLGNQPLANRLLSKEDLDRPEPRYPLGLERCGACGFVQLTHVVPPEEMFLDYPYATGTSPSTKKHFQDMAIEVARRTDLEPFSLVVDVGSNDGTLLDAFVDDLGIPVDVVGVEPAENLAKAARARQLPTISGFLDANTIMQVRKLRGRRADLITACNVFTHVQDPHRFLQAAKLLLADDGTLVLEIYYLWDIISNGAFDMCYHEHLSYFTVHTLLRLLKDVGGLEAWHVDRVPVQGGSLRVYVSRPGVHEEDNSVLALDDPRRREDAREIDQYEDFAWRVVGAKGRVDRFLNEADEDGLRVVGYAAAAKATVLCNYVGIGPEDLPYIVDKNPMKQGKYLPGVRIPIVGPEVLERDPPDVLFLFSWNLADEIVREWKPKLPNTRFIVAVPELREVG